MKTKKPWWVNLVLGLCLAGVLSGGTTIATVSYAAYKAKQEKIDLAEFGQVAPTPEPTPMLTQTSISHDPDEYRRGQFSQPLTSRLAQETLAHGPERAGEAPRQSPSQPAEFVFWEFFGLRGPGAFVAIVAFGSLTTIIVLSMLRKDPS